MPSGKRMMVTDSRTPTVASSPARSQASPPATQRMASLSILLVGYDVVPVAVPGIRTGAGSLPVEEPSSRSDQWFGTSGGHAESPAMPSPMSFTPITRIRTAMTAALLRAIQVLISSSNADARSPRAK